MANNNEPKKVSNIVRNSNDIFVETENSLDALKNKFKEFNTLLNAFHDGDTKVELRKRYIQRMIDETWVSIIEDTLPSIDAIIRKPGGGLDDFEEVKPIELTRKITSKSVIHLSQHTDYINEIKDDGTVMPSKVLNVFNDEVLYTYENKFVNTLINRVFSFVMLRYENAIELGENEKNTQYSYSSKFEDGDSKGKINITIEVAQNPSDDEKIKNYLYTTDLWKRVEKVVEWCKVLISSKFVKEMNKQYIHPPVMRTNKLLKNVDFRQCLSLWEFLESYETSGYETKVHESIEDIDEKFLENFYNSVIAQYILFQNSIENKINVDKSLDARENVNVDARIVDELKPVDEKEYEIEKDIKDDIDVFNNSKEEEIDFAIRVALAADEKMFVEDDYDLEDQIRIIYKYNLSYKARLIMAQNPCQDYYTELKNKLLSYKDIKSKISWKHESFTYNKNKIAMFLVKGKTLYVYLPLNPDDYKDNYIKVIDNRESNIGLDYPMSLKINGPRSLALALDCIAKVLENNMVEPSNDFVFVDYHYQNKTKEELCEMVPPLAKRIDKKDINLNKPVRIERIKDGPQYKYSYAFMGRLIMALDPTQSFYTELKNELLNHEGVKSSISWKHELFSSGKIRIAKLKIKGKTLCVYLPLNPKEYTNNPNVEDYSDLDKEYPMMVKVKSSKTNRFVLDLLNVILDSNNLHALPHPKMVDYHYAYKTPDELCKLNPPYAKRIEKKIKPVVEEKVQEVKDNSRYKYVYSFMGRLIMALDPTQNYYTELKNLLLNYEDVKSSISWKHELFSKGRTRIAKFRVKGKTLCVYLPLDPKPYLDMRITAYDNSSSDEDYPLLIKVKSSRTNKFVMGLLNEILVSNDIKPVENPRVLDYHYEYKSPEELCLEKPELARKLVVYSEPVVNVVTPELKKKKVRIVRVLGKNNTEYVKSEFVNDESKSVETITNTVVKYVEVPESTARYNMSYMARFIRAQYPTQDYYTEIKNFINKYEDIKSKLSWRHELFTFGRHKIAKFLIKGKTLNVYLPIDPSNYLDSKYKYRDVSGQKSNEFTPFLMRITSQRKVRHVIELLSNIISGFGISEKEEQKFIDYHKSYKTLDQMLKMKTPLVKLKETKEISFIKENKINNFTKVKNEKKYQNSLVNILLNANANTQRFYNGLKNHLESYSDLVCGQAWTHEDYSYNDNLLFSIEVNSNRINLILNESYKNYSNTSYHVKALLDEYKEVIDNKGLLEITSNRALKYACEIIDKTLKTYNLVQGEIPNIDYKKQYKKGKDYELLSKPSYKAVKKKGK